MDADEAKAEWFNAFRNILLFIRANPRKYVANSSCGTRRVIWSRCRRIASAHVGDAQVDIVLAVLALQDARR